MHSMRPDSVHAVVQRPHLHEKHLDIELLDSDWPLLAHAPGSPNCLFLQARVQGRLQHKDVVSRGEVDAHHPTAHGQQEHCGRRILLECLYCLHSSTLSTTELHCELAADRNAERADVNFRW